MPYTIFYSDTFEVPLPDDHRFPMNKYRMLREKLINEKIISNSSFIEASPCLYEDLLLAHDKTYIDQVINLSLDPRAAKKVGLPLIPEMVERAKASVGGFLQSTEMALKNGFSGYLAGGTHHAHADSGEGFCFFNDFAIAARKIYSNDPHLKILILDLDVHQGNGNATILKNDPNTFVVSFHGEKNYPFKKPNSDIDVGFPKEAGDEEYLLKLEEVLSGLSSHHFDILFYQAGVDGLYSDRFGSLNLSFQGLMRRDELVFNFARENDLIVSMALGGGYSIPIENSVQASANCYKVAGSFFSL